jgi:hypothetical protein
MFEIVQKRRDLSLDIIFLALSLGLRTRLRKVVKASKLYYRVFVYGTPACCLSDIPTKISRKQAKSKPQRRETKRDGSDSGRGEGRGPPMVALTMETTTSGAVDDTHPLIIDFNS